MKSVEHEQRALVEPKVLHCLRHLAVLVVRDVLTEVPDTSVVILRVVVNCFLDELAIE